MPRLQGGESLKVLLEELVGNGAVSDRLALLAANQVERLLRDKTALKAQLQYPYMVLIWILVSGDPRLMDAMAAAIKAAQVQPVIRTLEDCLWSKLCMIAPLVSALLEEQQFSAMKQYTEECKRCSKYIVYPTE